MEAIDWLGCSKKTKAAPAVAAAAAVAAVVAVVQMDDSTGLKKIREKCQASAKASICRESSAADPPTPTATAAMKR